MSLRSLVSKKKRRYNLDGFDLDLTYITDKIIAMGYPSENFEGLYRNKMTDVVRFLEAMHPGRYKVYNLCSERSYDIDKFQGRVSRYPFDDHCPPPMTLFKEFCEDAHEWLGQNNKNVIAVHCKAGKGRTGVMICAYLLYSGISPTAEHALNFYGVTRTKDSKGVTIPSQIRYVNYFDSLLKHHSLNYSPRTLLLSTFLISGIPFESNEKACELSFVIYIGTTKIYTSESQKIEVPTQVCSINIERSIPLIGDVKFELYKKSKSTKGKICHFCMNTFFVDDSLSMKLDKSEIDKAIKDKKCKLFQPHFSIRLEFVDPLIINN